MKTIAIKVPEELDASLTLRAKRRGLSMSLTDACLVRMYETHPNSRIFTLGHHFQIYRSSSRRIIKTIGLD